MIEPCFPWSNHTSDWKICTVVTALPDAWHYRVVTRTGWPTVYPFTGWDSKFDLQLLSQCGSMYNCQSRSVPTPPPYPPRFILHAAVTLGSWETNIIFLSKCFLLLAICILSRSLHPGRDIIKVVCRDVQVSPSVDLSRYLSLSHHVCVLVSCVCLSLSLSLTHSLARSLARSHTHTHTHTHTHPLTISSPPPPPPQHE